MMKQMMMTRIISMILIWNIYMIYICKGGFIVGSYSGPASTIFVGKYVFKPAAQGGQITAGITFRKDTAVGPLLFMIYDTDEEQISRNRLNVEFGSYNDIINSNLNCSQISTRAQESYGFGTPLKDYSTSINSFIENGVEYVTYSVRREFPITYIRGLNIGIGNCKNWYQQACNGIYCSRSLDVRYSIKCMNGDSYFGGDEEQSVTVFVLFFVLYCLLCVYSIYTALALKQRGKLHSLVIQVIISVFAMATFIMLTMAALSSYAKSGYWSVGCLVAAMVFKVISNTALLYALMNFAKGWLFVREKISGSERVETVILSTLFFVGSGSCWLSYADTQPVSPLFYIYEIVPGLIYIALYIVASVWFTVVCVNTMRRYHKEASSMNMLLYLGLQWLATVPIMALVCVVIPPYNRANAMITSQIVVVYFTQLVLVVTFNPHTCCCPRKRRLTFHSTYEASTGRRTASGVINDRHFLRIFQGSVQMKHSVVVIQKLTTDLAAFMQDLNSDHDDNSGEGQSMKILSGKSDGPRSKSGAGNLVYPEVVRREQGAAVDPSPQIQKGSSGPGSTFELLNNG